MSAQIKIRAQEYDNYEIVIVFNFIVQEWLIVPGGGKITNDSSGWVLYKRQQKEGKKKILFELS